MSDLNWYYIDDGKHVGPIDEAAMRKRFRDGLLKQDDPVWQEGMPDWIKAGDVSGLLPPPIPSDLIKPTPPKPPPFVAEKPQSTSRKEYKAEKTQVPYSSPVKIDTEPLSSGKESIRPEGFMEFNAAPNDPQALDRKHEALVKIAALKSKQAKEQSISSSDSNRATDGKSLKGISGWLILPAISLVVGPLYILSVLMSIVPLLSLSNGESIEVVGLEGLLYFSVISLSAYLMFLLYTAILFFSKKTAAPKAFIWMATLSFLLTVIIWLWGSIVTNDFSDFNDVAIAAFQACIWSAYFLKSKRVQNTFVE